MILQVCHAAKNRAPSRGVGFRLRSPGVKVPHHAAYDIGLLEWEEAYSRRFFSTRIEETFAFGGEGGGCLSTFD